VGTDAERLFTNNPHGGAIAEEADFRKHDALPLLQTARHRVPIKSLRTDDARAGTPNALDIFAYPGDEAAPTDGAKDGIEVLRVGELLEYFHPDGALAGDHQRVVVRGHKDEAVRGGEASALTFGLVKVDAVEDDLGAEAGDVAYFDGGRGLGHHDGARDAEALAGEGDSLGVVPWMDGWGRAAGVRAVGCVCRQLHG